MQYLILQYNYVKQFDILSDIIDEKQIMTSNIKNMQKENEKLIQKFVHFIAAQNDSENTILAYQGDLRQFCKTNNDQDILENIDQKVENYFNKIHFMKRKFAHSSLARKITSLKSFYRFLHEEKIIDEMPLKNIQAPKLKIPSPKMLLRSEIETILTQCIENFNQYDDHKKKIEYLLLHAVIEFLYSTGCRISEALSIKIGMIFNNRDEIYNEIIILGKGRKERLIFLNHSCQKALANFLRYKLQIDNIAKIRTIDEYLFSEESFSKKPISRHKIYYLLRNIASKCGIDPFRISPHILRHSVAIHMLMSKNNETSNNIMTIKKFLGHESIDTTKIYLGYDNIADLTKTINTKHPLSFL